jgi:hypothetical protein
MAKLKPGLGRTSGARIFMILDQASSHTAKITQAEAEQLRIELAWLPTACPELNPAELLWQKGRQNVSTNRTFASVDQQATAFVEYLLGLTPAEARQAPAPRPRLSGYRLRPPLPRMYTDGCLTAFMGPLYALDLSPEEGSFPSLW